VIDVGQSIGPILAGWMVSYSSAFTLLATILLRTAVRLERLFKEA
jgi:hypothetical protein